MEHRLEVEIQLSDAPPDLAAAEALVRRVAEESISKTLASRGRGSLTELAVDGAVVRLVLESDGARPHQALLALVRRLAEELGRHQKIGVRGFRSPRYRVTLPLEAPPKAEVSLPIPHTLGWEDSRATLELRDLTEEALRDNHMDRAAALVQEKVRRQHYEGKEQYWALLSESGPREIRFQNDPTEE
ncbi:seryl-tRNA synthetase, partial [mine drainage metagenome]